MTDTSQAEKASIQAEITRTKFTPKELDETDFIQGLVTQYLTHDGYVDTARAFREEILEEKRALATDGNAELSYAEAEEDVDAINRQSKPPSSPQNLLVLTNPQESAQRSLTATSTKRSNTPQPTIPRLFAIMKTFISSSGVESSLR
jgi:cell division septation protein DedD